MHAFGWCNCRDFSIDSQVGQRKKLYENHICFWATATVESARLVIQTRPSTVLQCGDMIVKPSIGRFSPLHQRSCLNARATYCAATTSEHILASLRVISTLLTSVAPDESSAAVAVELIETATNVPQPRRYASRVSKDSRARDPATAVLGRYVVEAVWGAVKSSRYRKNAPVWAAAVMAILHPWFFACAELHESCGSGAGSCPSLRAGSRDAAAGGEAHSVCGGSAIDGVGALLWFIRVALKTGAKGGGSRILRVMSHALCARLIASPQYAHCYASELFALGLSGEGGLTRAERQSMAAHWAESAAAEEQGAADEYASARRGERRGKAGRDAVELANWLELGGGGGAGGGHVATRVAVMCLVHTLSKAELPTCGTPTVGRSGVSRYTKMLAAESLELARESYRRHALRGSGELLRVALAAVSGGDAVLCQETYRRGSSVHRRKIRAWQLMCAASPALVPLCDLAGAGGEVAAVAAGAGAVRDLGALLVAAAPAAVAAHNLPGVRGYAELFYTLAAIAHPHLVDAIALPALRDARSKPGPTTSWIIVATGYVLRAPRSAVVRSGRDRDVLNAVMPWALAHNHMLRVFAQVAVHDMMEGFSLGGVRGEVSDSSSGSGSGSGSANDPMLSAVLLMLQRNSEMVKARAACGSIFKLDIYAQMEPRALLAGAAGGEGTGGADASNDEDGAEHGPDAAGFEGAPASALDRVEAFLHMSRRELRAERESVDRALWADAMAAGHDCSAPVNGIGVLRADGAEDVPGPDAAAGQTTKGAAAVPSTLPAMFLQKKVDGGVSSDISNGACDQRRSVPPFPVPNALEAMAAGIEGEAAAAAAAAASAAGAASSLAFVARRPPGIRDADLTPVASTLSAQSTRVERSD